MACICEELVGIVCQHMSKNLASTHVHRCILALKSEIILDSFIFVGTWPQESMIVSEVCLLYLRSMSK